jgi:hypothetical protein
MRTRTGIPLLRIVGLIAALVAAGAVLATSEAGDVVRSPPETPHPSHDTPPCGTDEILDKPRHSGALPRSCETAMLTDTYGSDFLSLNPEME